MMGLECTPSKFTDETKLKGVAESPEGHTAIQQDFDRPERSDGKNLLKFNEKCKVLPLGRKSFSTLFTFTTEMQLC